MKTNITANISITIYAPAAKVWDYLTRQELIKQYFFGVETTSDWSVGSSITYQGDWEGQKYMDKGEIIEIEPGKMIKFKYWSSMSSVEDKPENYILLTYDLFAGFNKTILTITQENLPTEKMKEHIEQNWMKILKALKNLVEE